MIRSTFRADVELSAKGVFKNATVLITRELLNSIAFLGSTNVNCHLLLHLDPRKSLTVSKLRSLLKVSSCKTGNLVRPNLYRMSALSLPTTSSSTLSSATAFFLALRALQSRLFTWSASTTLDSFPATSTSNG